MVVDSVTVTAGSVVTEMDTEGTTADEDSRELFRIMMDYHINTPNRIDVGQFITNQLHLDCRTFQHWRHLPNVHKLIL